MPIELHPRKRRSRSAPLLCLVAAAFAMSGCVSGMGPRGAAERDERPRAGRGARAELYDVGILSAAETLRNGDRLRDSGARGKALWTYLRAHRMAPESPTPRERIAYLHLDDDAARAEAIFATLVSAHAELASARVGLGLAQLAQGKLEAAVGTLEEARQLDPSLHRASAALGVVYDELGRARDAQHRYREAHALRPDDHEILNNLGFSYVLTGEYEVAVQFFRQAIRLHPGDAALHNNLGFALGRLRRYPEALEEFRRVGNDSSARNNLGYVLFANGEIERAIEEYEIALTHASGDELTIIRNLRLALDAL